MWWVGARESGVGGGGGGVSGYPAGAFSKAGKI